MDPVFTEYYAQISKVLVTSLTLASAKYKGDIVLEEGEHYFIWLPRLHT